MMFVICCLRQTVLHLLLGNNTKKVLVETSTFDMLGILKLFSRYLTLFICMTTAGLDRWQTSMQRLGFAEKHPIYWRLKYRPCGHLR
jgi:hypothetical protein